VLLYYHFPALVFLTVFILHMLLLLGDKTFVPSCYSSKIPHLHNAFITRRWHWYVYIFTWADCIILCKQGYTSVCSFLGCFL